MGQAEGPFNTNLSEQVYDSYQLPQSNVLQLANAQTYKGDTDAWATAITRAQAAATALGLGIYVPKAGGGPSLSLLTLDNGGAVYNVKAAQYGAKGDGITDDTTAINAAITAAAVNGGVVYLPPGTYVTSSTIFIPSNVYLQGSGRLFTTIASTAHTAVGTNGSGTSYTTYSNIGLAGLTITSTSGPTIQLRNATQVVVTQCTWSSSGTFPIEGLEMDFLDAFVVTENYVSGFPGDSILMEGCKHGRVTHNYILNSQDDAIDVDYDFTQTATVQSHHIVVANNVIEGTVATVTGGIRVEGSYAVTVIGNVLSSGAANSVVDSGIIVNSDGSVATAVGTTHDVAVVGNVVSGFSNVGIQTDTTNAGSPNSPNCYNIVIADNVVENCGFYTSSLPGGIVIHSGAALVRNNVLNNCGTGANGDASSLKTQGNGSDPVNPNGTVIAGNMVFNSNVGLEKYGNAPTITVTDNYFDPSTVTTAYKSTGSAVAVGSTFRNNVGYNPVGVVTPGVPASGSAVAAVEYDRTFYITTGAGATTVAIQGGPTVTLTASVLNTVRVPAGKTMTPTYANAPTWVVEGE